MRRLLGLLLPLSLLVVACGDDGPSDAERQEAFCTDLARLAGNDPFQAFGDRATAAEIRTAFQALVTAAGDLADDAPAEARASARDYADAATALESLLAGAGYDASQVDQVAYRDEQTAYTRAAARLEAYLDSECGSAD